MFNNRKGRNITYRAKSGRISKLVFDRNSHKLVGGSLLRQGHGAAQNVDFISLAIQMGVTSDDLPDYQYATHPELAVKPLDDAFVFATKDAVSKS